jgi:hypothetical protein
LVNPVFFPPESPLTAQRSSLFALRSPPKKPRQINVALTPIKTSQLEEHLEDK